MKFSKELIDQFFEMKIEMQGEAERLFDAFSSSNVETDLWRPPMDIYETVDSFIVKLEVAGIDPENDVIIRLEENNLVIRGFRQDKTELKKQHYHQAGLSYGHFERRVVLPNVHVEEVTPTASYDNGFLEIKIPKKQRKSKEIVVEVKTNQNLDSEAEANMITGRQPIGIQVNRQEDEDE